jgi:DNA-binding GntR family transcriptional regulator
MQMKVSKVPPSRAVKREPQVNLTDYVYEKIHAAIQDGTFEPGHRIREIELGDWLQVSRTPVREALRRLQSEGVLESKAGGLAVTSFDLRAVAELYEVRQTLEGSAAALAARNADPTELALLQGIVDKQRQCADDPHAQFRLNKAFHAQLYAAAHNRFLMKSLQGLHHSLVLLGPTTLMTPDRIAAAIEEHSQVVAAIVARDTKRAEELTRTHILAGYAARVASMTHDLHAAADAEVAG